MLPDDPKRWNRCRSTGVGVRVGRHYPSWPSSSPNGVLGATRPDLGDGSIAEWLQVPKIERGAPSMVASGPLPAESCPRWELKGLCGAVQQPDSIGKLAARADSA